MDQEPEWLLGQASRWPRARPMRMTCARFAASAPVFQLHMPLVVLQRPTAGASCVACAPCAPCSARHARHPCDVAAAVRTADAARVVLVQARHAACTPSRRRVRCSRDARHAAPLTSPPTSAPPCASRACSAVSAGTLHRRPKVVPTVCYSSSKYARKKTYLGQLVLYTFV